MQIRVPIRVSLPDPPDTLLTEHGNELPLSELTATQLDQLARAWHRRLKAKWEKQQQWARHATKAEQVEFHQ